MTHHSRCSSVAILHGRIAKAPAKSATSAPSKGAAAAPAKNAAVPALQRSEVMVAIALCLAPTLPSKYTTLQMYVAIPYMQIARCRHTGLRCHIEVVVGEMWKTLLQQVGVMFMPATIGVCHVQQAYHN